MNKQLFVDAKGKVVQVVEQSLETISATTEVLGVIELNTRNCRTAAHSPGAQVMHPAFA